MEANNKSRPQSRQSEHSEIELIQPTESIEIDPSRQIYPYCIVWSPIPLLTWLIPIVGHLGIGDSRGNIYDFAGSYYVGKGKFAFGEPTKYLQLSPKFVKEEQWDDAILHAKTIYEKRIHNLICDNCHSYVALCLTSMRYNGSSSWNMVILCFKLAFQGHFVDFNAFLKTWLPFVVLVSMVLVLPLILS